MGLRDRLLRVARDNLNALVERALGDDQSLEPKSVDQRQAERSVQEAERQRRLALEAAARSRGSVRKKEAPARKARRPSKARIEACYATLGLSADADASAIKRAYRTLMREHHPDRHPNDKNDKPASDRAAAITAAYEDLTKRRG